MSVLVFVGPSCPSPLLAAEHPSAVLRPPAAHGDLYDPALGDGDTVVLIDGVYHHRLALRHKEILDALDRGVTVIGAASIGALRAVELAPFGMIGCGRIYHWYRTGVFDGDDAVAVAHGELGERAPVSVPLVNVRAATDAGVHCGVLTAAHAQELIRLCREVYYPLRTWDVVLGAARSCGAQRFARWCADRIADDRTAFDQKLRDTMEAVRLGMDSVPDGAPVGPLGRAWRTEYERRWRNHFSLAAGQGSSAGLRHRMAYQQIFNPVFPSVWWNYLERTCPTSTGGRSLRDHVEQTLGSGAGTWFDSRDGRARITQLFCPTPEYDDPEQAALLLCAESQAHRARVQDWSAATSRYFAAHPQRSPADITEQSGMKVLGSLWGGAAGPAELGSRGFQSARHAVDALRPLSIGFLQHASRGRQKAGEHA